MGNALPKAALGFFVCAGAADTAPVDDAGAGEEPVAAPEAGIGAAEVSLDISLDANEGIPCSATEVAEKRTKQKPATISKILFPAETLKQIFTAGSTIVPSNIPVVSG